MKTVDFSGDKITGPHRNSVADELAAMANTHTGVVLLSVDDILLSKSNNRYSPIFRVSEQPASMAIT